MFQQAHGGGLTATCEDCDEPSPTMPMAKELAILRLMRAGWRVRTMAGITRTWCPACQPIASVARLRVAR